MNGRERIKPPASQPKPEQQQQPLGESAKLVEREDELAATAEAKRKFRATRDAPPKGNRLGLFTLEKPTRSRRRLGFSFSLSLGFNFGANRIRRRADLIEYVTIVISLAAATRASSAGDGGEKREGVCLFVSSLRQHKLLARPFIDSFSLLPMKLARPAGSSSKELAHSVGAAREPAAALQEGRLMPSCEVRN